MDAKLTKDMQKEFHRLNAACGEIQAKVDAEQAKCADAPYTDPTRSEVMAPMRERVRELGVELMPLARERSRLVLALGGKTGAIA